MEHRQALTRGGLGKRRNENSSANEKCAMFREFQSARVSENDANVEGCESDLGSDAMML
jgi:hypothetical protein